MTLKTDAENAALITGINSILQYCYVSDVNLV